MALLTFSVLDTAMLCGLTIKPGTESNDEVPAKCPFCNDYKYRMYLSNNDPQNQTWYCHNCGTGGNAITLYAYMFSVTTKEAYQALKNNPEIRRDAAADDYSPAPVRIRSLQERSQIYFDFLQLCGLSKKHERNLMERGLSREMIAGNLYRSYPVDCRKRQHIVDTLADRYDLADMPGFYKKGLQWRLVYNSGGILIPVCTENNLIQGLQIRLDNAEPYQKHKPDGSVEWKTPPKYLWLSSPPDRYQNGTGIKGYSHIVGDLTSDTLYLTEGPLKADVSSYLADGSLFVGLTGVQNTQFLKDIILSLRPRRIVECIDMDIRRNAQVKKAQARIQTICMPLCEEYECFYWPEEQKGIDDYLLFEKLKNDYRSNLAV